MSSGGGWPESCGVTTTALPGPRIRKGGDQQPKPAPPLQHVAKDEPGLVVRERRRAGRARLVSLRQTWPEFHVASAQSLPQLRFLRHRRRGQAVPARRAVPGSRLQPPRRLELGSLPLQMAAVSIHRLRPQKVPFLLWLARAREFRDQTQFLPGERIFSSKAGTAPSAAWNKTLKAGS